MKKYLFLIALSVNFVALAQVDTTSSDDDEFDFSDFELAAEPAKAFCNNKVIGQSPTTLVGIQYNFQGAHEFTAGDMVNNSQKSISEQNNIKATHGWSLVANLPIISKNNILINANLVYDEQHYVFENNVGAHPFTKSIANNGLRSLNTIFTVFKPLNQKNFILGQIGFGLNGNYGFGEFQSLNKTRIPIAALYGWKPNNKLMYAFGISRTYLGGALNYVPIAYYYRTFNNDKWGIEALLPARAMVRYRYNSLSMVSAGFNVIGNTYSLNNFSSLSGDIENNSTRNMLQQAENVELRRSEIRLGCNFQKSIKGFLWFNIEAGYRINYSFDVDEGGDFARPFGDDKAYYIENDLGNPLYFQVGISYVSP